MKTKLEILTKIANDASYESWGDFMHDSHDDEQIQAAEEAMEIYAAQSPHSPAKESVSWKEVIRRLHKEAIPIGDIFNGSEDIRVLDYAYENEKMIPLKIVENSLDGYIAIHFEELRIEKNTDIVAGFMEHCKGLGIEIPDTAFESFFNA